MNDQHIFQKNNGIFPIKREKTEIFNNRLYLRNSTSAPVTMQYGIRSVQTRYVHMPLVDERKKTTVECNSTPVYNSKLMFTPSSSLPFNGYQENVDVETRLRGAIFPIQSCARAHYIPDSKSDLFNNSYLSQNNGSTRNPHSLLDEHVVFKNQQDSNINKLGYKLFHNHTKIQTKDI
jgi:hypothetical protein